MTVHIAPFDPHTASDQLWAAFNETRRAIAREFWPDEPILNDAETRQEVLTTNPMVEFRRWVAMEEDEVAGSIRAAFRRPGTSDEKDYARFLWAGGGVRASSRRRGVGTLLLREVHGLMPCGGLEPAPDSRFRGTYRHLLHSISPPSVRSWHALVSKPSILWWRVGFICDGHRSCVKLHVH